MSKASSWKSNADYWKDRAEKAEATIAHIRPLPEKWRKDEENWVNDYHTGDTCADALDKALEKTDVK